MAVGPLLGEVDADAAERLVLKIANKKIEISEIADTLRSLVTPLEVPRVLFLGVCLDFYYFL
ncbi:hypothetical protein, partial [uncultured Corynebacterium sp.]|uniref:hypothetical protein n=1 Tax=uncultured Corynebacterium sp. TaxID=159447 RepID=UPI002611E88C